MIEAIAGVNPLGDLACDKAMCRYAPKKGWTCWFNDDFKYHIEIEKYGNMMFNGDGAYMKFRGRGALSKEEKGL